VRLTIGSDFATLMAVPAGSIAVTGALTTYTEPGGITGGPFHRRFYANCGTPIILEREGAQRTLIAAGTPHRQAHCQSVLRVGTAMGADRPGY
jgi:hypothetical protein